MLLRKDEIWGVDLWEKDESLFEKVYTHPWSGLWGENIRTAEDASLGLKSDECSWMWNQEKKTGLKEKKRWSWHIYCHVFLPWTAIFYVVKTVPVSQALSFPCFRSSSKNLRSHNTYSSPHTFSIWLDLITSCYFYRAPMIGVNYDVIKQPSSAFISTQSFQHQRFGYRGSGDWLSLTM